MEQELAYSFHLGSDKNKSKLAKRVSKDNVSGTTSLSNNAIQNAKDLSRVNSYNLRDYNNQKKLVKVIYGTNNIITDVKDLIKIVPNFKTANTTIHFDKTSPHIHIIGVPVVENCTIFV